MVNVIERIDVKYGKKGYERAKRRERERERGRERGREGEDDAAQSAD